MSDAMGPYEADLPKEGNRSDPSIPVLTEVLVVTEDLVEPEPEAGPLSEGADLLSLVRPEPERLSQAAQSTRSDSILGFAGVSIF